MKMHSRNMPPHEHFKNFAFYVNWILHDNADYNKNNYDYYNITRRKRYYTIVRTLLNLYLAHTYLLNEAAMLAIASNCLNLKFPKANDDVDINPNLYLAYNYKYNYKHCILDIIFSILIYFCDFVLMLVIIVQSYIVNGNMSVGGLEIVSTLIYVVLIIGCVIYGRNIYYQSKMLDFDIDYLLKHEISLQRSGQHHAPIDAKQ